MFFFPTGGGLIMMINDIEYQVKDGDAFRVEPGEKHNILNNTKNDYKIIFIKNPSLPEDKISC
jgi:mannose-6-phosphate isomerase-like protein (cupin superfamily)